MEVEKIMSNKDKKKNGKATKTKADALEVAIAGIEKAFGKGTIQKLTGGAQPGVQFISTGCAGLDEAMGGGFARGRIAEVYGPESSGKTTLTLETIAECQTEGGICAFIDVEHALDPVYAEALGVNLDTLLLSQPDSGEQALQIVDMLARSGAVDLIVVDSVSALVPIRELEGEIGDSHVGGQARLMSQALRVLAGTLHTGDTAVIFINQIRMKIGVMFGNPETTSGGNALKFYASQRLDIRGLSIKIKDGETITGRLTRVRVVKSKVAPPFRVVEFNIMFGTGIDKEHDLLMMAVAKGIVEKSGSWYSYNNEKLGQGTTQVSNFLTEHPYMMDEIREKVLGS